MEILSNSSIMVGVAGVVLGASLFYGWQRFQRCPHCGRIVKRAGQGQGWLRCTACGRQYRWGLRIR